ncbi:uncharacterized protein LOC123010736 [Tribolium madens]|uniref:uncharacterized protein LOC123010736 n=1 Tax=Tribolium madens TaxID=41895 RepID=UPI001CF738C7|nr:uncharacterized protein LOC123010736 [Tribolium madens]XP_044263764.1 uncharacterized protein LOC123010736 [Tribolium madens]XP_044263765.1 uncharacterized protein LOC123010736 [Tribolium madens]
MKGEIINCPTHKDIYFLETNTKSENTNLVNLFASPAGREMFKYKPRPKLKQKLNPALEFFIQSKSANSSGQDTSHKSTTTVDNKCSTSASSPVSEGCRSRRSSIDLYEEAASILGLTCSQTDDCKCIECQCHYFDFEEDIDYPSSECVVDHSSSCTIQ